MVDDEVTEFLLIITNNCQVGWRELTNKKTKEDERHLDVLWWLKKCLPGRGRDGEKKWLLTSQVLSQQIFFFHNIFNTMIIIQHLNVRVLIIFPTLELNFWIH